MDDNTFECPNCGAKIYPEMTRCPHCGHSMYPEDEQGEERSEGGKAPGWVALAGAVVLGWVVASGVAMLVHFIVAAFVQPESLATPGKAVLFLAAPVGSLLGGYVCANLARQRSKLLGSLVGVLSLLVSILLATHWVQVTPAFLLGAWVLFDAALVVLAGVLGGWLSETFSQDAGWQEKWRVRGWEDLLYQDLLRKVRFSGPAAERLIAYEKQQDPQANRLKLIQNAIERWERDNR